MCVSGIKKKKDGILCVCDCLYIMQNDWLLLYHRENVNNRNVRMSENGNLADYYDYLAVLLVFNFSWRIFILQLEGKKKAHPCPTHSHMYISVITQKVKI